MNDSENDGPHTSTPYMYLARPDHIPQMTSQSIADEITITRQLWRKHVKMISNSLYTDLIHGGIQRRERTNNAWATMNNDFGVKSEAICQ